MGDENRNIRSDIENMSKLSVGSDERPLEHRAALSVKPSGIYVHFPVAENQIRLLRGHVQEDGSLAGELCAFSLEASDLPVFTAVSYTWGSPLYGNALDVGGRRLPVLDSLFPFLRQAFGDQRGKPGSWWWIDSICINQDDDSEKAGQVPLMGRIYRCAEQTSVWLGEEADNSHLAMDFLRWLDDRFRGPAPPSQEWIDKISPRDGPWGAEWNAMEKLFARPWWTRVWTVQEFTIPKRVMLFCGSSWIIRSALHRAMTAIYHCRQKTLKYDGPWNRFRFLEWYLRFGENEQIQSMSISLTAALAYLGYQHATDPRDRLYSLSGLVKDFELAGTPDYKQPFEILYTKMAKSFVEKYDSLDVICFAGLFRDPKQTSCNLPSWVPDWSFPATAMVGPLMVSQGMKGAIGNLRPLDFLHCSATYSASLGLVPKVKFSGDLREMTAGGFLLDTIDGLAGLPAVHWIHSNREQDDFVQSSSASSKSKADSSRKLQLHDVSRSMRAIMRCLVLDRGDHYFNHTMPTYQFIRLFKALLSMAIKSHAKTPSLFYKWYETNRNFLIQGWTLENLSIAFVQDKTIPKSTTDPNGQNDFIGRLHDTVVKMKRRLAVTDHGLLAMAPMASRKGDLICILFGCSVPVVLRKIPESDAYTFIGECFVDSRMNGEALTLEGDLRKEWFRIV